MHAITNAAVKTASRLFELLIKRRTRIDTSLTAQILWVEMDLVHYISTSHDYDKIAHGFNSRSDSY